MICKFIYRIKNILGVMEQALMFYKFMHILPVWKITATMCIPIFNISSGYLSGINPKYCNVMIYIYFFFVENYFYFYNINLDY